MCRGPWTNLLESTEPFEREFVTQSKPPNRSLLSSHCLRPASFGFICYTALLADKLVSLVLMLAVHVGLFVFSTVPFLLWSLAFLFDCPVSLQVHQGTSLLATVETL